MGSGTVEHFSKWREGLVKGRLTIDLRRQALETLLLVNLHFVGKGGGGGLVPSPPPAQPSLTF